MCGNPYVTYIEECYIKKCGLSADSAEIQAEWQSKKLLYRNITKTTVYEFMNYSMHDESHAIHILESIEMFLGKERVDKLSRSDLWLLLNAAYAHDIGMATKYQELEALWSNADFRQYVKETQNSLDKNDAKAATRYLMFEQLLRGGNCEVNSEKFSFNNLDAWPLEFRKDVTLLMGNYVRKRHGKLTKDFFDKIDFSYGTNGYDRIYGLVGDISLCHTEGQESLEKLPVSCKGFGTDLMHPRFIAMLLRLGDLLDLDNNRFDIFSLQHFGPLPNISVAHYKKHKSIVHLHIVPHIIEVTAKSDDFEVCKINQSWFSYLREDIEYLITHWSVVAPDELSGCLLGLPKLEVIHGDAKFTNESVTGFILEKQKLLKLFTGNNLYSSDLDFIREYVQNAFDASKMQLFYEVIPSELSGHQRKGSSKAEIYLKAEDINLNELRPFDFKKIAYDAFSIGITVKPDGKNRDKFVLQIVDKGIGIDKEGLEAIVNVGSGWKKRNNHKKAIAKMREWMKPTGGFGIGLQSAFLVTDEVTLFTKPPFDKGRRITLSNYANEKNVLVEIDKNNYCQGTTAEFKILFEKMQEQSLIERYLKMDLKEVDVFSVNGKLRLVYDIIKNYILETFPAPLFPIKMILLDENEYEVIDKKDVIGSYLYNGGKDSLEFVNARDKELNGDAIINDFCNYIVKNHKNPSDVYFYRENTKLKIWDDGTQILYGFELPVGNMNVEDRKVHVKANYKSVLVKDDTKSFKWAEEVPEFASITYDVMGLTVEECLVVSRNAFHKGNAVGEKLQLDFYTKAYAHMLLKVAESKEGWDIPAKLLFVVSLLETNKSLANNVKSACASEFESEVLPGWKIEKKDGLFFVKEDIVSIYSAFQAMENEIVLVKASEDDRIGDEQRITYFIKDINATEMILMRKGKPFTESMSKSLPLDVRVLNMPKICAVLARYRDGIKEIYLENRDVVPRIPAEMYVINTESKTIADLGKEKGNKKSEYVDVVGMNEILSADFKRLCLKISKDDPEIIPELIVKRVPFVAPKPGVYYIILPYSSDTGMRIYKGESIKQVLLHIIEDATFDELCSWVYDNQKEARKYNKEQIKDAYKSLIQQVIKKKEVGEAGR